MAKKVLTYFMDGPYTKETYRNLALSKVIHFSFVFFPSPVPFSRLSSHVLGGPPADYIIMSPLILVAGMLFLIYCLKNVTKRCSH